jgi:dipeptidyl aminopeptidase/acylaminoacyl peptidase
VPILRLPVLVTVIALFAPSGTAGGQGTAADYSRAEGLRRRLDGLVVDAVDNEAWIGNTSRFWYRKSVIGGTIFMTADAATLEKKPAFDHAVLAASLSSALGRTIDARSLPFNALSYSSDERTFEVTVDTARFTCTVAESRCTLRPREGQRGPGGFAARFGGGLYGDRPQPDNTPKVSPDGKTEAAIRNFNVFTRPAGSSQWMPLSTDGSEANAYAIQSISWSPDSKKLAAYRVKPGFRREVHYIMSSPEDQIQPKDVRRLYSKPGDVLDVDQPVLFDLATRKQTEVSNALFPNAYEQGSLIWRADSRAVTFEYNQRGHQVFRVIEIDAGTGVARAIINEETPTFFEYSAKRYRYELDGGAEIVWASERDGWNHLYLYDGKTGQVKNQITRGRWLVRGVDRVDPATRQVWFRASGMYPGKDPYFIHYYRINLDGSGLTTFTEADANHALRFSGDGQFYLDRYSRVDLPTVLEVRRTSDQKLVLAVEKGDATALLATGWRMPQAFVAKGRDDTTNIYGVIIRPTNFNPSKKYPVIENIYAGPHDSFVPKTWGLPQIMGMQAQAELGFIVAQIDGMGTSNRSKAFHDVAWQNIGDAGFPDRIKWHKAFGARNPWYDVSKVGIYGGSAGGQNAMGALLRHPDFYKVAVSFAGCHDNRMDKIWWNEQWMGWPLGAHYDSSSNVVNAHKLQGKLLLLVGELDENVDPSSTLQVANALIKSGKTFDLFIFPGGDHGAGRRGPSAPYGERKQWDYFVHHLLGVEPPDWNTVKASTQN